MKYPYQVTIHLTERLHKELKSQIGLKKFLDDLYLPGDPSSLVILHILAYFEKNETMPMFLMSLEEDKEAREIRDRYRIKKENII